MATERLPMRHIREILRLKWTLQRTQSTARDRPMSHGPHAVIKTRRDDRRPDLPHAADKPPEMRFPAPSNSGRGRATHN